MPPCVSESNLLRAVRAFEALVQIMTQGGEELKIKYYVEIANKNMLMSLHRYRTSLNS